MRRLIALLLILAFIPENFSQRMIVNPYRYGVASLSTPTLNATDALGPAPGSGTSYQFTAPAGIGADDIVIAKITLAAAKTITAPTGWTLKQSVLNDSTTAALYDYIFWKREDSTPDATYNFTWTGSTFRWGWIGFVEGAVTSGDPFDAHMPKGYYIENTTLLPGATFTSTVNNVLGIAFYGIYWDSSASTPPNGWTEAQDAGATSGGGNCPLMVATLDMTTAGSYEIRDASYTGVSGSGSSTICVLGVLPAGATAGTVATTDVQQFFDFEASTSGTTMTDALLRQSHFSDYHTTIDDKGGTDAYTGMTFLTSPFGSAYIKSGIGSGGVDMSSAGSMSFQFSHTASGGGDGARLKFNTLSGSATEGGSASSQMYALVQFNAVAPSAADVNIDHFTMNKASGGYAVLQQVFNNAGTYTVRAHSTSGGSTFGSAINITSGHLYWVALLNDATAGSCEVKVYDAENSNSLVGTSTASMTTGSSVTQVLVGGGYIEGTSTGTTVYDNIFYVDGTTGWPMIAP
jgi:hypothetical protein